MSSKGPPKLPVAQLIILAICRTAEPVALTSVYPYLPEMIESFGIAKADVAKYAGYTSSVFSVAQAITAIPWGRASDIFGRKAIILIGLTNTAVTFLLWGFSTSLPMAMASRALQGAMNGNVGIIRTMVAEMCPWKELQPRAFSVMPLVWNLGSIFGPSFGGLLSNPYHTKPGQPHGNNLLERFPYALPNIVAAAIFTVGITVGFLFLRETLDSVKDERDIGVAIGQKFLNLFKKSTKPSSNAPASETSPLLKIQHHPNADVEAFNTPKPTVKQPAPKIREVLTVQSTLNLLTYTLLATYSIGYDQLLPVFMHYPHSPQNIRSFPFRFSSGFGLPAARIGLYWSLAGLFSMVSQFFIFPVLARRYGALHCLRCSVAAIPFVYFLTPFTALLPSDGTRQAGIFIMFLIKQSATIFLFPCCTILLTNSASSPRVLATLNGLATSTSALGRAAGPAIGGKLFTWGAKNDFVMMPYIALGLIAALSGIPLFFTTEGKSYGDIEEESVQNEETNHDDGHENDERNRSN